LIIVTGGAGFIGSNFVKHLNDRGIDDILIVDDMTDSSKAKNLANLKFSVYLDKEDFFGDIRGYANLSPEKIFHFGAISSTTFSDGKVLIKENYHRTLELFFEMAQGGVPLFYASSASVYGNSSGELNPLNCYALSKKMVDDFVSRRALPNVYGFRFFNVFGPGESHKGGQASPVFQFRKQAKSEARVSLFNVSARRDFVPVSYACEAVWQVACEASSADLERKIFDVGTGSQLTFSSIASMIAERYGAEVDIVDFPSNLRGKYQFDTKADLSHIEGVGDLSEFVKNIDLVSEVENYLDLLDKEDMNDLIVGLGPE
jgi:ADP-L-glycero-D-manno-heptose 6-epimerase